MDEFWRAVADFVEAEAAPGAIVVAPARLAGLMPVTLGYGNVWPADAEKAQFLVLHKGEYQELDPAFLRRALERMRPVFANEVFIVVAAHGRLVPDSDPHVGQVDEIRAWSQAGAPASAEGKPRLPAIYLGDTQVLVETIDRHLVVTPSDDRAITPHLIRDGYFEVDVPRFIQRFLKPGMTFVDVGANIGLYSLAAAVSLGGQGRIVAIEPLSRLRTFLIDNLTMNGIEGQAVILPFAAGEAVAEMQINEFRRYNGATTLHEGTARHQIARFAEEPIVSTVTVRPLTEMLDEVAVTHADLIKIDTEGFEYEVLLGAQKFLTRQKAFDLVLEWHPEFRALETIRSLLAFITEDLGCALEIIGPNGSARPIGQAELMATEHANLWVHRTA